MFFKFFCYREKRKNGNVKINNHSPFFTRVEWKNCPFPKSNLKTKVRKQRGVLSGHRRAADPRPTRGRPAGPPERRPAQPSPWKNILTFFKERKKLATFFQPFYREERKKIKQYKRVSFKGKRTFKNETWKVKSEKWYVTRETWNVKRERWKVKTENWKMKNEEYNNITK